MYLTIQSPNVTEFSDHRNNHVFCSAQRERMSADLKGTSACCITAVWCHLQMEHIKTHPFNSAEALMNFTASIQSKKKVVCFGNQATRWFLFVRQATLWHSEWKSTAIVCQLPSGSVVAAASWFVIVSPLLLAPLFGLTVINSVAHSQSLHRLILVWSRWMPILTQAKGQTGTIAWSKHMLCASSDLISTVKKIFLKV